MFAFFGMPGQWEMVIIGLIAVLLFGNQLPKLMRNLGKAIPEFKRGAQEFRDEMNSVKNEVDETGNTIKKELE